MSLAGQVSALATRIANTLRDSYKPRLLPLGGTAGQPLVKTGAADYATGWVAALPVASGGTGATTAAGALANLGLNTAGVTSYRNRLINGALVVNARAAATASTTYAAGAYIADRWKAGASGVTVSFATAANGIDVVATITAGTLCQVIEGGVYLLEGGAYVLSWAGTATARVWQGSASGSYAAAPVAVSGLTAGTNATVEFGVGTLSLAQFEPGTAPTVFERREDEAARCQRYFQRWQQPLLRGGNNGSTTAPRCGAPLPVPMRAKPSATLNGTLTGHVAGYGTVSITGISTNYSTTAVMEFDFTLANTIGGAGQVFSVVQSGTGSLDLNAEIA